MPPDAGSHVVCHAAKECVTTYLGLWELGQSVAVQTGEVGVDVGQCPLRLGQRLKTGQQVTLELLTFICLHLFIISQVNI